MYYRSLRVRKDMSPAGIVRIVGDILCEHVRNNWIFNYSFIFKYIYHIYLCFFFINFSFQE